jgi:ABC-type polysaccharide/polyol phosphate transport system ATPase subunit
MLMRLAFATSVLVDPDILIIDEVLAVGDIRFQKKCVETILAFKKRGKAIIFVSHDMGVIKQYADRAMFLNNGKAEKIGSPAGVIASYEDFCRARDKLDDSSNE